MLSLGLAAVACGPAICGPFLLSSGLFLLRRWFGLGVVLFLLAAEGRDRQIYAPIDFCPAIMGIYDLFILRFCTRPALPTP